MFFFWLCQLSHVRRSLDVESVTIMVHAVSHRGSITATRCLLLHRRESQTSCGLLWMLQHVWSLGLRSTSMVCHGWCMMTCTGWLFLRGCSTSSPW